MSMKDTLSSIYKNETVRAVALTAVTGLGTMGCAATGLPSMAPGSQGAEGVDVDYRGAQTYEGTNEPIPVQGKPCRQLQSAQKQLAKETRNLRKPRATRRGRNEDLGDTAERLGRDAVEGLGRLLTDTVINAGKRKVAQPKIDALYAQCEQSVFRASWENSVVKCSQKSSREVRQAIEGSAFGVPLGTEYYNETCVSQTIGGEQSRLGKKYGLQL